MKPKTQILAVLALVILAFAGTLGAQDIQQFEFFSYGPGPNGIAVDAGGNVYTQTGIDVLTYNGLWKFAPDGSQLNARSFYAVEMRMVMDPNNQTIWGVDRTGNVFTINPSSLDFSLFCSLSQLGGWTIPSVYNIATMANTSLLIFTPLFGDIAALRTSDTQLSLFITGVSDNGNPPRGVPFVLRLDIVGTTLQGLSFPVTRIDAAGGAILYNEPRGIAVSRSGTVVTTLPKTVVPYSQSLDYPVAFSSGFPTSGTAPHYIATSPLYSLGGTADNFGNFYIAFIASGAVGSPVCGGTGVFFLPGTLDFSRGQCVLHDLSAVFTDVGIGSQGDVLYASMHDAHMLLKVSNTGTFGPVITRQPQNQTVAAGQPAVFSVTASNVQSYVWQMNGFPLADGGRFAGTRTSSFTLANVQTNESGARFACIVSNAVGSVTSSNALLTVQSAWTPYFSNRMFTSNGLFWVRAQGATNARLVLDHALSLPQWTPLSTNVLTNGIWDISVPMNPSAARFFRLRYQP